MENWEVMRAYYIYKKPVQIYSKAAERWIDFKSNESPTWNWRDCEYRVKPEIVFRAWKPDEVPMPGFLLRWGEGPIFLCVYSSGTTIGTIGKAGGYSIYHLEQLAKDSKVRYSVDNGKTWQRCGVLEEE